MLDAATLEAALAEQQGRVTEALEAFAENTLRHLREEGELARGGDRASRAPDPVPRPARARRRARARLQVATCGWCGPYVRDFRPVLVAVDGGADALREVGLAAGRDRRGLRLGLGRRARGRGRARRARVPGRRGAGRGAAPRPRPRATHGRRRPGSARTSRCSSPTRRAATLIVAVGTHFNLSSSSSANRAGMASTFVTRLKVGESLVDAKGVSRLVSRRVGHLAARRVRRVAGPARSSSPCSPRRRSGT